MAVSLSISVYKAGANKSGLCAVVSFRPSMLQAWLKLTEKKKDTGVEPLFTARATRSKAVHKITQTQLHRGGLLIMRNMIKEKTTSDTGVEGQHRRGQNGEA